MGPAGPAGMLAVATMGHRLGRWEPGVSTRKPGPHQREQMLNSVRTVRVGPAPNVGDLHEHVVIMDRVHDAILAPPG